MQLPPQWRWKLDRWKESMSARFAGKPEEARPKLCPACGTLVGAGASKCHNCGTSMSFSMAAVSRAISEAIPQEMPVTYFLLASNFLLFLVCLAATWQFTGSPSLFGGIRTDILVRLGGRSTYLIMQGEVWRLVMPIFLHGSLMHIGMNMFVLKDFGPQLEEVYGSARFLFLYVITGAMGFVWTTAWDLMTLARHISPGSALFKQYLNVFPISIGASGSLMGLLGLAMAITTLRGGAYMQMIRGQLLRSIGVILVLGLIVPGIDNAAHIGGFISGFMLGRVVADRQPVHGLERKRAYSMGWLGGLMIAGSFAATVFRFLTTNPSP